MKIRISSFVLLLVAFCSFAIPNVASQVTVTEDSMIAEPTELGAAIHFEETAFEFDDIIQGETVTHVFTFTNTGDEILVISNVKGSCGCTVPQWPREPIAPGETASLTVAFNSKGKEGMQSKRVTITANTDPAITLLGIKGRVIPADNSNNIDFIKETSEPQPSPDCFAIYPNPTAEVVKLEMKESALGKVANVSILSNTGQLMAKREIESVDGSIEFNVSHYPAGTYIAHVQVGEGAPVAQCFVVVD